MDQLPPRFKETFGNRLWRLTNLYKIRTKDRRITTLHLNNIQKSIWNSIVPNMDEALGWKIVKPVRGFDLKYRQGGVSTFWLLFWLDDTLWHRNTTTGIQAHKKESLGHLWEIVRFAYDNMPPNVKPKLDEDSKTSLSFGDRASKMFISLSIRSTALHNLHISEMAYCATNELMASMAACSPASNITCETTGNGLGNMAYETYQDAKMSVNEYNANFFPWFIQNEYRAKLNGIDPKTILDSLSVEEAKLRLMMRQDYGLELLAEQVLWRRQNKRLLKDFFPQEFPENDKDAFLASGSMFFDGNKLEQLYRECREAKPYAQDQVNGHWIQYAPPKKYHKYAMGVDPSEGGPDACAMKILDVTDREEVWTFTGRINVKKVYQVAAEWGGLYNNALLGVERNNHGHAVLLGLEDDARYQNIFEEGMLGPPKRLKISEAPKKKLGWSTTEQSRAVMLDHLKSAIEGDPDDDVNSFEPTWTVYDKSFLSEALTFKEIEGKFQAVPGKHDDQVIATAIANQMYQYVARHNIGSVDATFFASGKREAG